MIQSAHLLQKIAGLLSSSFFLARGKRLFELNQKDWNLPLSKLDKLLAGSYIILNDYAEGKFPPTFEDQAQAYQSEIDYTVSQPGVAPDLVRELALRKPFWGAAHYRLFSQGFTKLLSIFERLGIRPRCRVLELGCGAGWMAEFLALTGYSMVASSLSPDEIQLAQRRLAALQAKRVPFELRFLAGPMESIDRCFSEPPNFDCVFVFEALHHAYDWRQALQAAYRCLKPKGWLVLANEPNRLHTFVSYRVGKLSNTHEIGMSRKALVAELKNCGFADLRIFQPCWGNFVSAHWIAARK